MKEYSFVINSKDYNVKILSVSENKYKVEVNGQEYEVLMPKKEQKTPVIVPKKTVDSAVMRQPITDKPENVSKKLPGDIVSPLPGQVLKILVNVGDTVEVGKTVVIIEAMKMENEVQALTSGKVKEILVKEGDNVLEGDIIMRIGE